MPSLLKTIFQFVGIEFVNLIMKHRKSNVNVHKTTNWGDNAAHHAASKGTVDCLKYLIDELNVSVKKGEVKPQSELR